MAFTIIRNDITKVKADAVVNTANPLPVIGGGTDSAIYTAAGEDLLLEKRREIGNILPGNVASTPAFHLNAKWILHTVGPSWEGGKAGEFETLHNCYRNSLKLAKELNCESIAFPLIATGVNGFPKAEALQIAVSEFRAFLENEEMDIFLVVFDRESFVLSGAAFDGVEAFVDGNYVEETLDQEYSYPGENCYSARAFSSAPLDGSSEESEEAIKEAMADTEHEIAARRNLFGRLLQKPHRTDSAARFPSGGRKNAKKAECESALEEALTEEALEDEECAPAPDSEAAPADKAVSTIEAISAAEVAPAAKPVFGAEAAPAKAVPKFALSEEKLKTASPRSLDDVISQVGETWQESLLRLIDEKGYTDAEVYKRANVDRKLFSKIRSNKYYQPKKATAVAFALALNLNLDETKDLLGRAGYAFSPGSRFDLIIEYFIEQEVYDFYTINLALFDHDQPLLGA